MRLPEPYKPEGKGMIMDIKLPLDYEFATPEERRVAREKYIELQNGICIYCGKSLKRSASEEVMKKKINWRLFPDNFLRFPVHLHHDHTTGLTKGAVHNYCNAVLWQYHGE